MKKLGSLLTLFLTMLCLSTAVSAQDYMAASIQNPQLAQNAAEMVQAQSDDCYVYLAANCLNTTFTQYTTGQIDFVISSSRSDYYFVTALVDNSEVVYFETMDRISSLDIEPGYEYLIPLTFDLDDSIPLGNYTLLFGIVDANGDPIDGIYSIEFSVVSSSSPVTSVSICNPDADYAVIDQLTVCPGEEPVLVAQYESPTAPGYHSVVFESFNESVFTVENWAGYAYITPKSSGQTTLTVTVDGNVTCSIPVYVGHEYIYTGYVSPTCVDTGARNYICQYCSAPYSRTEPALGHNVDFNNIVIVREATACLPGESILYCDRCQQNIPQVIDPDFVDTQPNRFYSDAVDFFYGAGIMRGVEPIMFGVDAYLSRGMLVTILYRMAGEPDCDTTIPFTDVEDGKFFSKAVAWAYSLGITKGSTETTFEPMAEITREELAAFIYRYATNYKSLTLTGSADLSTFPDAAETHNYAKAHVAWAVSANIISGSSDNGVVTLMPRGTATRAQAATMLYRYLSFEASQPEPPETPEAPDDTQTPDAPQAPDEGQTPDAPVIPDDTQNSGGSETSGDQGTVLDMVWVPTRSGKRYHTVQDCGGMKNPKYITLEDAIAQGFTPCKNCVHNS